jgi:hypothetical protein
MRSGKYLKRKCDDENEDDNDVAYCNNNTNSSSISAKDIEQSPKFTFVELFAGIGGFRLGLERIGGSCVLASERDEITCEIYRLGLGLGL